jgi:hypothetical protein
MITQCAYRSLHTQVEGSTNSAGRWIYQQWSSQSKTVIIFMKNSYLNEYLQSCILYFFIIGFWVSDGEPLLNTVLVAVQVEYYNACPVKNSVCNSVTFQSTPSRLSLTPQALIRPINETGRKRLSWPGNIKELSKLCGIRLVGKWDVFNHELQKWTGPTTLEWLARNVLSHWNSDWLTAGSELTAKLDLLARTRSCAFKDFNCPEED